MNSIVMPTSISRETGHNKTTKRGDRGRKKKEKTRSNEGKYPKTMRKSVKVRKMKERKPSKQESALTQEKKEEAVKVFTVSSDRKRQQ